jgi:hypothetical protein
MNGVKEHARWTAFGDEKYISDENSNRNKTVLMTNTVAEERIRHILNYKVLKPFPG